MRACSTHSRYQYFWMPVEYANDRNAPISSLLKFPRLVIIRWLPLGAISTWLHLDGSDPVCYSIYCSKTALILYSWSWVYSMFSVCAGRVRGLLLPASWGGQLLEHYRFRVIQHVRACWHTFSLAVLWKNLSRFYPSSHHRGMEYAMSSQFVQQIFLLTTSTARYSSLSNTSIWSDYGRPHLSTHSRIILMIDRG